MDHIMFKYYAKLEGRLKNNMNMIGYILIYFLIQY